MLNHRHPKWLSLLIIKLRHIRRDSAPGLGLGFGDMAKHTKKVGVVGEYGTCCGASSWKMLKKLKSVSMPTTLAPSGETKVKREMCTSDTVAPT